MHMNTAIIYIQPITKSKINGFIKKKKKHKIYLMIQNERPTLLRMVFYIQ